MIRQELLPHRIEALRSPAPASSEMLRLCRSERDAVLTSIALSGLTYAEIGARCGVSKQAVEKWARKGIPHSRTHDRMAQFCVATGTLLPAQYDALQMALRAAEGHTRERDYIQSIVRAA